MNTFGYNIRLTTFGESHGPALGGILDGFPPMVKIDFEKVKEDMEKRAPGRQAFTSPRKEPDEVEFLSGLSADGVTLGTPIGFIIRNKDHRSGDYAGYAGRFRPNHADYTYYSKYGINEFAGGGRASARATVSWVAAGALCRQWLATKGVTVSARFIETNSVEEAASNGDSTGGIVEGVINGLLVGVGEPLFGKLHSRLAAAMMSINAAKAFEYGDGVAAAYSFGSNVQDLMIPDDNAAGGYRFLTNHSGGIQGGISNGMPVNFKVYFKPTPTLMREMEAYDTEGKHVIIPPRGRHDPCVAKRAPAIVEAMALLTVADLMRYM